MLLNEPIAALRVVNMRLVDTNGDGLSLATVFAAGDSKISKAGAAFANTANLPQPIATGVAGTFTLQLSAAEVDTVGQLRIQISATGGQIYDAVDEVRATSLDASSLAEAVGDLVLDADAPAGAQKLREVINILVSWAIAEGTGYPQSVIQTIIAKSLGGDKTRVKTTISGGRRIVDELDGT